MFGCDPTVNGTMPSRVTVAGSCVRLKIKNLRPPSENKSVTRSIVLSAAVAAVELLLKLSGIKNVLKVAELPELLL